MKSKLIVMIMLISSSVSSYATGTCLGRFPNPITDICWSCMFPFWIVGMEINNTLGEEPIGAFHSPPVCMGKTWGGYKIGVGLSFYDPNKMVDVTRTPFCLVGLGGVNLGMAVEPLFLRHGTQSADTSTKVGAFYQAHTYIDPLLFILEAPIDTSCTSTAGFDIGYLTELDPAWNNDNLTFYLNPDAVLYATPLTPITTGLDCVSSMAGVISQANGLTYWSAGCQGSMYPLDGNLHGATPIDDSVLTMERFMHKLHREMLQFSTAGAKAVFAPVVPAPIMDKTEYKYSMVYPVRFHDPLSGGKCCSFFGRTTMGWDAGHNIPITGEDFAYHIYQRRDCCSGITIPD